MRKSQKAESATYFRSNGLKLKSNDFSQHSSRP